MPPSQADEIRRHALDLYVQPWRESGSSTLSIRAGDVVRSMGLRNRTPNVCSALESYMFQQEAGLVLIDRTGPRHSTSTTFRYQSGHASAGFHTERKMDEPTRSHDLAPYVVQPRRVRNNALPTADLCLVSCVKTKLPNRAPARQLYVSDWFRKARAVVEARGWPWRILSAKYGLVDPEMVIEPYEMTLNNMRRGERVEWSRTVMTAFDSRLTDVKSVVIFAGERYREFVVPALRARNITVHIPMEGLRSGEQLSQLSKWLDR